MGAFTHLLLPKKSPTFGSEITCSYCINDLFESQKSTIFFKTNLTKDCRKKLFVFLMKTVNCCAFARSKQKNMKKRMKTCMKTVVKFLGFFFCSTAIHFVLLLFSPHNFPSKVFWNSSLQMSKIRLRLLLSQNITSQIVNVPPQTNLVSARHYLFFDNSCFVSLLK